MRPVLVLFAAGVLLIPTPSLAQATTPGSSEPRFFVDVNLIGSAESRSKAREFRSEFIIFSERGSAMATYPRPSRSLFPFEVGGGVMLTRGFGLAASYARIVYEDAVSVVATFPDPEFLGAAATDSAEASLERKETAVHVSMVLVPVRTDRTRWRLLFGPSFFSYRADMVRDVAYVSNLARPQTAITITGINNDTASASATGIHAGIDFEYVFARWVGLTAGTRYDDANVTLDQEPMSNREQRIRVGSLRFVVGVRIHPD